MSQLVVGSVHYMSAVVQNEGNRWSVRMASPVPELVFVLS